MPLESGNSTYLRQRRVEVVDVMTQNAPCFTQSAPRLRPRTAAQTQEDPKGVGNPLELPDVPDHLARSVLGMDFLGLERDLVELRFAQSAILRSMPAILPCRASNGFLKVADGPRGTRAIQPLHFGGNLLDGMLELLHSVLFARQQRNGQGTDFLRKLLLQHRQWQDPSLRSRAPACPRRDNDR